MTVFSLLKGAFIFASVLGLIVISIGVWKAWSAYDFTRSAEVKQGIFRGYHVARYKSITRDSSGLGRYRTVEEHLPMFAYKDSDGRHEITGTESHFFRHLRSKVNEPVKVLVSPDDPEIARLGDALSLYCSGGLLVLTGLIFFLLPRYGAGLIDRWRSDASTSVAENKTFAGSIIGHIGQMTIPVNDVVIVLGGFLLIAGGTLGYAYYFFNKRQNISLIEAIRNREYDSARILSAQGLGVDAKSPEGESALIIALKANQSELARSILNNLWITTHVTDVDGTSAIQLAAINGDYRTLALLFKKGEQVHDIKPAAIYHLIRKGDAATLKVIIDNGLDLNQTYTRISYGDQAILDGQIDVVRLIQKHNGLFKAPAAFVALATNDEEALRTALEDPKATSQKFSGFTLEGLSEKIGRNDLLKKIGGTD